ETDFLWGGFARLLEKNAPVPVGTISKHWSCPLCCRCWESDRHLAATRPLSILRRATSLPTQVRSGAGTSRATLILMQESAPLPDAKVHLLTAEGGCCAAQPVLGAGPGRCAARCDNKCSLRAPSGARTQIKVERC